MSAAVPVVVACTAIADDNGMRALCDVATGAAGRQYLVIGGHMVRILRHVYDVPGIPRVTSDADAGIDEQVAIAGDFHHQLTALGYADTKGNRYERGEQAVDLLVPTEVRPGKRYFSDRAFDGAPGLRLALASTPIPVAVTARLTDGSYLEFEVPVPDVEAAFVMKMLAWNVRDSERDVQDLQTLLEIAAAQPQYRASPWRMDDPAATRSGERKDAARAAARMIASPPRKVPARVRALLRQHVAAVPR
ncbi:hypothetical protein [Mycolicibacterium sp. XJ1819]